MSAKLTRKNAQELLDSNFITQEQYDKMFEEGIVSSGARSTRPEINVPNASKAEFVEKAYEALVDLAKKMKFDHTKPHAEGGVATLYIKGSGSPRSTDETEDSEES